MQIAKEKIEQAKEAATRMMAWDAEQEADLREEAMAENIWRLAEDAKKGSVEASRKANIAIGIAIASVIVSIVIGVVFGCLAHHDSDQTTKAIVEAIGELKGSGNERK